MILDHADQVRLTPAARACVAHIHRELAAAATLDVPGYTQVSQIDAPFLTTEDLIGVLHALNGFDGVEQDLDEIVCTLVLVKRFGDVELHLRVSQDRVLPPALLAVLLASLYSQAYLYGTRGWSEAFDPELITPISTELAREHGDLLALATEIAVEFSARAGEPKEES